jgi:hypothetical protein
MKVFEILESMRDIYDGKIYWKKAGEFEGNSIKKALWGFLKNKGLPVIVYVMHMPKRSTWYSLGKEYEEKGIYFQVYLKKPEKESHAAWIFPVNVGGIR